MACDAGNDPTSATAATKRGDCNRGAMLALAEADV